MPDLGALMSEPETPATPPAPAAAPPPADTGHGLYRYAFLVGIGAFVTTFVQIRVTLGALPTNNLLKTGFLLKQDDMALFFFWATFAWNLKPVAGVLTDAFPIFGTRRRHYMMIGAVLAAASWLMMGAASGNYQLFLTAAIAMNTFTVLSSTVMGGMMVEAGQKFGAPGRISSLRQVVQSASQILGPTAGGILAGYAYGWTTGIAAGTLLLLAITTFVVHDEKQVATSAPLSPEEAARPRYAPTATVIGGLTVLAAIGVALLVFVPELQKVGISLLALEFVLLSILALAMVPTRNPVIVRAQGQLTEIFGSRTLWLAVAMLALVYTVPGLHTALYYQQTEVLKFTPEYIGNLGSIEGTLGIISAVLYGVLCRRFPLQRMLIVGVGLASLTTFGYLAYGASTAPWVHGSNAFTGVLAELALMDLAVRSTPKGCEALGFSLMMATRNFGIALSDVLGTAIMEQFHVPFRNMVIVNGSTTLVVLLFVFALPAAVMMRKEGDPAKAAA